MIDSIHNKCTPKNQQIFDKELLASITWYRYIIGIHTYFCSICWFIGYNWITMGAPINQDLIVKNNRTHNSFNPFRLIIFTLTIKHKENHSKIQAFITGLVVINSVTLLSMYCLTDWLLGNLNNNLEFSNFKLILVIDGWTMSCYIALSWMSLDLTEDKSTLVQVMAWWRQATSHYLSQCWPTSVSPYGVIRPQWVNSLRPSDTYMHQ